MFCHFSFFWLGGLVVILYYCKDFLSPSDVNLILTYTLIVITAWYAYSTRKQVLLIEKEKKANLISSSIKPKIEDLITILEGNISKLHKVVYYSYEKLEYNLSVNLKEIEIDWLFRLRCDEIIRGKN